VKSISYGTNGVEYGTATYLYNDDLTISSVEYNAGVEQVIKTWTYDEGRLSSIITK